jgi:ketosteroid isomerase-like protein
MSQEPRTPDLLELTRRVYASLNSRDFDALMGVFGPTSVWDVSRWGLGTHAGLVAIRRFLEDWFGSLDEYEVQVEEMHDLGNGIVFVVVTQVAHRARSRGVLRVRSAPVFLWAEGKIALITLYPDVDEGRAAAVRAAEPSSQRNIDLHSHIVEAIGARREVPHDLLAPGFLIESRMTSATDYKYHGASGLREWASDLFDAFLGGARYGVDEVVDASDDFVVAMFSVVGRGAHSREPLELRWAGVTWFRDGKATRAVGYTSRHEALKAVGLAE